MYFFCGLFGVGVRFYVFWDFEVIREERELVRGFLFVVVFFFEGVREVIIVGR